MAEPDSAATASDRELAFDDGIPGFPRSRRFRLAQAGADRAFQLLESLDEPDVALLVVEPWLAFPDYAPDLPDADCAALELDEPEQAAVVCAVTVDGAQRRAWANLRAPFVINVTTGRGRQVVLDDDSQPLRAELSLQW